MFFGDFSDWQDVMYRFDVSDPSLYTDVVPLFAVYNQEGYEGSALVLFLQKGKIWLVSGGHCSCYGLEGQFDPEEMSAEALIHMMEKGSYSYQVGPYSDELKQSLRKLAIKNWQDMSPDELSMWIKLKF